MTLIQNQSLPLPLWEKRQCEKGKGDTDLGELMGTGMGFIASFRV